MSPTEGRHRRRGLLPLLLFAIAALLVPAGVIAARTVPGPTVDLQVIDISDWHGALDPVGGVGGAAVLKAYFDQVRATSPNNLTLTAGDDVGATPPLATYFEDVPAILAERMMGIQVGGLGNHNFDSGLGRLQSQIDLAGSTDPSVPGTPFRYVSSNLSNRDANISGVSDYAIFEYKGVNVAVIGITNEEAPSLNFPGSMGTMVPTDSVAAAMAAKAAAAADGANVFIAITHKGVTSFNNGAPQGELIDFANGVSGFHLIVGDHTDIQFSGTINGQFVVENRSKGISFSTTKFTFHRGTGAIVAMTHMFFTPTAAAVTPDAAITAMLQPFRDQLGPILSQQVGDATKVIPRADACGGSTGRLCESLIGNVIADAMRETYETDFALMNSGGIRADLTCPAVDSATDFCPAFVPPPYVITSGQVLTVLPFGNVGDVIPLNGVELLSVLENGVSRAPAADGRFPQVSGLCLTFDIEAAAGSRVTSIVHQAADGSCTGGAVDLTAGASYTLATNDFVAAGGDGYPNFASRGATRGVLDQDVSGWLMTAGTIDPNVQGRIVCFDPNPGAGTDCPAILP
jgi:2',3'-cyclic-nucleotide 2'-phosphodiesterase (5'-nucleotidase family)